MKRLPNLLTLLRMLGAAALIGLDAKRPAFWIIYALCGLSDMLDGHLARRLHAESALGGRLVCAVRLLPLCAFPRWLWVWIGGIALVRLVGLARARAAVRHTRLNRLCGLIIWLSMPLIVRSVRSAIPACLLASAAAVQDVRFMRKP